MDDQLMYVDRAGAANRAGNVWLSPGYRYTRTGRCIRAAKVRFPAVSPAALGERLVALVGGDLPAVDVVEAYFEARRRDET